MSDPLATTLCPDRGTAEPSCTPLRVPRAAQAPVHRIPHPPSPGGTSSPPRARAYPSTALSPSRGQCTRFRSGLATHGVVRDDFWPLSVRAHQDGSNGTIFEFASLRLGCRFSSQAFRSRCARPFSPPPFTLTAAHPSPPAPPHVCRVQPKQPCIACRTHSAQAVPLPLPEHAHTHRPALSPSRGRCTRFRSGLATPGVRGHLLWRDLYVRAGVVSTVPCTSSVAAVCRCELLPAVVFSRVAGAWLMVAGVCYSSVYFFTV